ncbi:MAG: hypothetical protein AAGD38_24525 [Acidobacteriota bacterium]
MNEPLQLPRLDLDFLGPDVLSALGGAGVAALLIGGVLLLFGRQIYWLALGAVGFVVGLHVVRQVVTTATEPWVVPVLALIVGVIGALFAVFAQKLAVRLAGFLLGAGAGVTIVQQLGTATDSALLLAAVIGAVVGILLSGVLFDAALTIISAAIGAILLLNGLDAAGVALDAPLPLIAAIVLTAIGIGIQSRGGSSSRRRRRRREATAA